MVLVNHRGASHNVKQGASLVEDAVLAKQDVKVLVKVLVKPPVKQVVNLLANPQPRLQGRQIM